MQDPFLSNAYPHLTRISISPIGFEPELAASPVRNYVYRFQLGINRYGALSPRD